MQEKFDPWLSPKAQREVLGGLSQAQYYRVAREPDYPQGALIGKNRPVVKLSELQAFIERRRITAEQRLRRSLDRSVRGKASVKKRRERVAAAASVAGRS